MLNFFRYGCSTLLVLGGAILAFLALVDAFRAERNWIAILVMLVLGVGAFLGGTAVIEISNARVRRAGEADALERLPRLAAEHGVVTTAMLYDLTSLSTMQATRFLERLVESGRLERVPHGAEWGYRFKENAEH
jgi:heme A synthase